MYLKEREELLKACLKLKEYKLISLTGGNISMRLDDNTFLVTPSGMLYEEMIPDDICVIDKDGNLLEGIRKPSSDTSALLYMFEKRKDINAIIHTHQPYATAIGLNNDVLPDCLVTLIDACKTSINVAPWTRSSDIGMGKLAIDYLGQSNAVIMKHHGVITIGKDLEEALYAAIYLEEGAKTYCIARIMGDVPDISPEEKRLEALGWLDYGQK